MAQKRKLGRVLVTGGAGFLGSHLCERLLAEGCQVIAFDNLLTGRLENIEGLLSNPSFAFEQYDVTNHLDVEGGLDAIMHFASPASPADFERLPIQILKVGSLGTHKALGLAKAKQARFLLASTSECYGDPEVSPQPESYWGNVNPIGIRGVYDEAKRFAEAMTMAYHRHHGVEARIVRIFNTFGPRMRIDDGRAIPNFFRQAIRGEPVTVYGDGSQTRSICYVDDLIEGIWRLLNSEYTGPVNIGSQSEISMLALARSIVELTGSSSEIVFGELPPDDPKVRRPDISLARRVLDWQAEVSVEEGLRRARDYFVEELARRESSPLLMDQRLIRNFCIIAHIDHGKSTLADRLLDETNSLTARERRAQFLDKMDLERERGITIKAQTARMAFEAADGETYAINLIDTPGHVDFSYEVSRALQACEGAVLVVDASQGIEAQTLANAYLAVEADLGIIPVVNKIDLPSADPDAVAQEIEEVIGLDAADALPVSAKEGTGVRELLERIVTDVRPPSGDPDGPLRALIFDAWFDPYVGVAALVRVVDGVLRHGARIKLMARGSEHDVQELDVVDPHPHRVQELGAGEVGVMIAGIKSLEDLQIGDTVTEARGSALAPLPGFREVKPMVFSGLYPVDAEDYEALKTALEKLRLNDASFRYEPETSVALGFGFRCGFLGFLHGEIIRERLEREYGVALVTTAPTVRYRVVRTSGEVEEIESPAALPPTTEIERIEEPMILATIHVPQDYVGNVLQLCQERRGRQRDISVHGSRVQARYELPLAEVVADFHDRIKSATRGYGSYDYDLLDYEPASLVKLDILVNGDPVDALSLIVHRDKSHTRGAELARKLKEFIPRQMFEVAIQAAVGSKVIARTTVKALRKNVTAKCYGGDISRKRKLLERQKEGKRRMKRVGAVEIPQEAFLAALKLDDQ